MLSVGGSSRIFSLPVRGFCSVVIYRKSLPPVITSSPGNYLHRSGGGAHVSGVRALSGGSSDAAGGWYSSLANSTPVHLCEQLLVSVQEASGLPWWFSICVATLSVRTLVTLPLAAYQLVVISKVEALQTEISELAKRLRYEVSVRNQSVCPPARFQFKKNLRRIVSQLYIRDNCHPFKASLLVWVQLPLWISLSLALRNLTQNYEVGYNLQGALAAGGALWFPDLTIPDSTWILPVCLGLTNLLIVEVFSLQRVAASRTQRLVLNTVRGFSLLMIPIAATVPSSMALYWFASSLVGFSHNLLLRSPSIRRLLQLSTPHSTSPYRDLLTAFIAKYHK
uniref:Membrane insertase YidC/Oxa/ALB C-terminal domain-containing protein n=1 Tax=Oreochromis aureus TaxID=47969 RepID=A0A668UVX9_OREAU